MHEVRLLFLQVLHEAIREGQVEVAGTEQVLHVYAGHPRGAVDARTGRAHKDRLVAALGQRRYQVDYLLRSAIEMASGFYMQYFNL